MYKVTTNYFDNDKVDLGKKLVSKDYLLSYYPDIADTIVTPELWTWGRNDGYVLGDNTLIDRSTPITTFAGGANWKQISVSGRTGMGLKKDGTLWVWGIAEAIGINTTTPWRATPVTTFAGGTNWSSISYNSGIKTDGTLWMWGANEYGQLGIGTTSSSILTPVTTLSSGDNWKQVGSGRRHTAAIKKDGTLWTWGTNINGQLGVNTTTDSFTPVTTFIGGNTWKQISCGYEHNSAIKTDGTLWTWGKNSYGQLGIGTTIDSFTPVQVGITSDWKFVNSDGNFSGAIKNDGTLWMWGVNAFSQLGDNTTTNRLTPVTTFAGGTNWRQVDCGEYHTGAIKTDGSLWVWGRNTYGALGNNTTLNRSTPVTTFAGGTNWKQIGCGEYHTVAIKSVDFV